MAARDAPTLTFRADPLLTFTIPARETSCPCTSEWRHTSPLIKRGVGAGSHYGRAGARSDRRLRRRTKLVLCRATYVEVGPMTMMHQRQIRYIGLDVHKATISAAIAEESGAPTSYGRSPNDPAAVRTLMTRLGGPQVELRVAYEAGPTGYALHRQLTSMAISCMG